MELKKLNCIEFCDALDSKEPVPGGGGASALAGGLGAAQSVSAASINNGWDCNCGNKGVVGNFCNNCGAKRPEITRPDTWDCSCGNKGIVGNFCNNCGNKRGE